SLEVRSAVGYATLILLLAMLPVFLLPGVSGSMFQPLAVSYALALLASMVVALTVTPALCLLLLSGHPGSTGRATQRRESPLLGCPIRKWHASRRLPVENCALSPESATSQPV